MIFSAIFPIVWSEKRVTFSAGTGRLDEEKKIMNDTQAETTRLLQTRLAALETMLSAKTALEGK